MKTFSIDYKEFVEFCMQAKEFAVADAKDKNITNEEVVARLLTACAYIVGMQDNTKIFGALSRISYVLDKMKKNEIKHELTNIPPRLLAKALKEKHGNGKEK